MLSRISFPGPLLLWEVEEKRREKETCVESVRGVERRRMKPYCKWEGCC